MKHLISMLIRPHFERPHFPLAFAVLVAALWFTSAAPLTRAQVAASATTRPEIIPATSGTLAEKIKIAGVNNSGKVSEALFRGGQPSEQGVAELRKLGVTTVVDLRGNRGPVHWERNLVVSLGMRFINIPI